MGTTMKDVARHAGVSVGTVSRYINGYRLKEINMKKVKMAIEELGFKENIIAKGLKNKRSMTIGVVIASLTDIFSTTIVTSLEKTIEKENYSMMLCDYNCNLDRLHRKIMFLQDRMVDGVVLFAGNENKEDVRRLMNNEIPVVVIDSNIEGIETDRVNVDNVGASFRATEKLIHSGHERIAVINGTKGDFIAEERLQGYISALNTYDITINDEYIRYGNYSSIGGYNCLMELLECKSPPTSVFITNYYMTIGAITAINELDIKIPRHLSLICFDRFEIMDVIKPSLTFIEQPTDRIGEMAGRILLKRIKGDMSQFPMDMRINTRMVMGKSIAPPGVTDH